MAYRSYLSVELFLEQNKPMQSYRPTCVSVITQDEWLLSYGIATAYQMMWEWSSSDMSNDGIVRVPV